MTLNSLFWIIVPDGQEGWLAWLATRLSSQRGE